MLRKLQRRQLVLITTNCNENFLTMHKLLKRCILHSLGENPAELQRIFDLALLFVRKGFPAQSEIMIPSNELWQSCAQYLTDVLSLQSVHELLKSLSVTIGFAELLCDAGNYLWERSMHSDASRVLKTAGSICESLKDDNFDLQARIHCLSAILNCELGI